MPDASVFACESIPSVGVHIMELTSHHCGWVLGEPRDLTYCGLPRWHAGTPYCRAHHNQSVDRRPGQVTGAVEQREKFHLGRIVRSACTIDYNPVAAE